MDSKLIKIRLFLFIFVLGLMLMGGKVNAEGLTNDNELIKVNNNVITKTTTIDQINNMFGVPVAVTDSAFGGKAYSYTDSGYTWYLHVETNASGSISGYGAIGGNFVAKRYAYNDIDDSHYWYLSGTILSEFSPQYVYGIYEYNITSTDVDNYWETYNSNSSKYLYDLQKHAIIAAKVLAKKDGHSFSQTYCSDDMFYINEQLKYNNSNLYDYANDNEKSKSIICVRYSNSKFYEDLPNPIALGDKARNYVYASAYQYLLFDVEITNEKTKAYSSRTIFINPSFLTERKKVALTSDEESKLSAVKKVYEEYYEHANNIGELYDVVPQYEELPLVAGKYNKNALLASTDWLNIARVSLGLNKLQLDDTLADYAQHKAVMVYYANLKGYYASHYMPKPEGVDQDFYDKAQTCMNENLFMGSIQSSIDYALNDGYGDPVECGHRYNLLDPGYTSWGVGSAGGGLFGGQGCHKFSGYSASNTELVAWPSNGIFALDLAYRGIGNWTAMFYKNYEVTSDTTVSIECLNTGEKYEINQSNSDDKLLTVTGKYLVTFRDDNINYENGDVFKITLHNIKNKNTNQLQDYTYRSVFYSQSTLDSNPVTDITLNVTSMNLAVGQVSRIYATIAPSDATNKLTKFTSSNSDIVTITQNGIVTAKSKGEVDITITSGNIEKIVKITVTDSVIGDMNIDNKVNSTDAALVLDRYKNNDATDIDMARGDMDGQGQLNAEDASKILDIFKTSQEVQ